MDRQKWTHTEKRRSTLVLVGGGVRKRRTTLNSASLILQPPVSIWKRAQYLQKTTVTQSTTESMASYLRHSTSSSGSLK